MPAGPIGVASSSASQATSQNTIQFNPILTLMSPESSVAPKYTQGGQSNSPSTSSEAKATASMSPFGGGGESDRSGLLQPLRSLSSNMNPAFYGGGPIEGPEASTLGFELGNGMFAQSGGGGINPLLIIGGLAAAGLLLYVVMR